MQQATTTANYLAENYGAALADLFENDLDVAREEIRNGVRPCPACGAEQKLIDAGTGEPYSATWAPCGCADAPTTECIYCGHDVPDEGEYVPTSTDDEEWQRLAVYHDADCHWVRTRADRLDEQGNEHPADDPL